MGSLTKRLAVGAALAGLLAAAPLRAESLDLAFGGGDQPVGEITAAGEWGALAFSARHSEYLSFLNRAYDPGGTDGAAETPLRRSSSLAAQGSVDLPAAAGLEGRFSLGYDEWRAGGRDLTLAAETALRFPGLRLDHRLSLTTTFDEAGGITRRSSGELILGLDLFDASQEGRVTYETGPLARITGYHLDAAWDLGTAGSARLGFSHHPLEALSEARFSFSQPLGPFDMSSDIAADSRGAYSLGVQFSLPLGATLDAASWRLSSTMTELRARQTAPAVPVSIGQLNTAARP